MCSSVSALSFQYFFRVVLPMPGFILFVGSFCDKMFKRLRRFVQVSYVVLGRILRATLVQQRQHLFFQHVCINPFLTM